MVKINKIFIVLDKISEKSAKSIVWNETNLN